MAQKKNFLSDIANSWRDLLVPLAGKPAFVSALALMATYASLDCPNYAPFLLAVVLVSFRFFPKSVQVFIVLTMATGILVHTPITHGHIITVLATAKDGRKITREEAIEAFRAHPRIRTVTIDEGFKGNASFFKYARDLGNRRADMYEIGLWEDSVVESGNDIMFAIHIPQESVTIPETIDGVRAVMQMQATSAEATAATNRNLGIGRFKK